jgi:hypothetical protein
MIEKFIEYCLRTLVKLTKATTCGDECYKASGDVDIEAKVGTIYLHAYVY